MQEIMHSAASISPKKPQRFAGLCLLVFAAIISLSACDRQPPLPPELASIQCASGKEEHGRETFGNAEVVFVCINKDLANRLDAIRCDLENRSMLCDEIEGIMLSRSAEGKVYAGQLPKEVWQLNPARSDTTRDSSLIVGFHSTPPEQQTFDAIETNWEFLLTDATDLLPRGFTLIKGTLCDRTSSVLNNGTCRFEAKSASLYWDISISIRQKKGTPISPDDYREELAYWSKYIEKIVVDPKA